MSVELRESVSLPANGVVRPAGTGSRNSELVAPGSESDQARATVVAPAPSTDSSAPSRGTATARAELRQPAPSQVQSAKCKVQKREAPRPIWNLTIPQVAGFLQVTEKTIDRMVRDQEIGSTKIGRSRLFPREEVCRVYAERFLAGRRLHPGEALQIAERALESYLAEVGRVGPVGPGPELIEQFQDLQRRVEALEALARKEAA